MARKPKHGIFVHAIFLIVFSHKKIAWCNWWFTQACNSTLNHFWMEPLQAETNKNVPCNLVVCRNRTQSCFPLWLYWLFCFAIILSNWLRDKPLIIKQWRAQVKVSQRQWMDDEQKTTSVLLPPPLSGKKTRLCSERKTKTHLKKKRIKWNFSMETWKEMR